MLPFSGPGPMLEGSQDSDDAVQSGVHVGVAACVVTHLGECIAEVVLDDVGEARLGLHRRRERWAVSPGRRLPYPLKDA